MLYQVSSLRISAIGRAVTELEGDLRGVSLTPLGLVILPGEEDVPISCEGRMWGP